MGDHSGARVAAMTRVMNATCRPFGIVFQEYFALVTVEAK